MQTNLGDPLPSPETMVEPRIKLLFVEDDDDCREAVSAELDDYGFSVQAFRDGHSMLRGIAAPVDADAIILDWNLPDISGIEIMSELSTRGITIPVVFLTGYARGMGHEMQAFESGAFDFIDKTRGAPILVKRLRLIVKNARPKPKVEVDDVRQVGRLSLRPSIARAYWDGRDVGLTFSEFNVLSLLASDPKTFHSYRKIYDRVHYEGFIAGCGDEGFRINVRSCIKRIRNKFRACDPSFLEIENYAAVGYRWQAT
jgi:two-component system response regulator ChvI